LKEKKKREKQNIKKQITNHTQKQSFTLAQSGEAL
jgi:hypothetical protein